MDFKVVVAIVAVAFSGFLFYQNQKRSDMLLELNRKYQQSIQQAHSAGASAIMTDEALMDVIRQSVKAELEANPIKCPGADAKFSVSDAAKLQDVNQRLVTFEKKFNKAASLLAEDGREIQDKITNKATRLKDKIVALCKK